MLVKMTDFIFDSKDNGSLEHRVLSIVALFVALTGVLTTIQNIIMANPTSHIILSVVSFVVGGVFFWLSRVVEKWEKLAVCLASFFLALLTVGWFSTNGTYGAAPYFFIMLITFAVIVLPAKIRFGFVSLAAVVLPVLIYLEFHNPVWLGAYPNNINRYLDVSIAFMISILVMSGVVFLMLVEYHREKRLHLELLKEITESKEELEKAMGEIKTLSSILPICASCKKIRNDTGSWEEVATYISSNTDTQFSHGICPDCCSELYPEFGVDGKKTSS